MQLSEVAGAAGLDVVRDGSFQTLAFISHPKPGMLGFIESSKYLSSLENLADVSCIIVPRSLAAPCDSIGGLAVAESPRLAFAWVHEYLLEHTCFYWSDFETEIHPTARIHPRAWVSEQNVRIGAGARIDANVTVQPRCIIGDRVIVEAGAVLGAAGFQTITSGDRLLEMTHAGSVVIEVGAKVFSNAVVASGLFREATSIGAYCRVGAAAFVSHNAHLGARSFIGHGAVINGNVKIGDDVWVGPGSVVANGLRIGDRAQIIMGSSVIRDVDADRRVSGNFAIDHRSSLRRVSRFA